MAHVVLVPDAWSDTSYFDSLAVALASAGFESTAHISSVFTHLIYSGHNVIALFHNYGGIPGSDACEGWLKHERVAAGKSGGIIHVVYMMIDATDFECYIVRLRAQHFMQLNQQKERVEIIEGTTREEALYEVDQS